MAVDWDLWDGEGADGHDYCQSIYELAQLAKPMLGLEIGVRFGKSALAALWGSPELILVGIDPNPEYPVAEFLQSHARNRFSLILDHSPGALAMFSPVEFDWIYVDGRHDYDGVLADFTAAWPLLKVNGYMVFDDYKTDQGYRTDVQRVLKDHAEAITGQPFKYLTTADLGLYPNPHGAAILRKETV